MIVKKAAQYIKLFWIGSDKVLRGVVIFLIEKWIDKVLVDKVLIDKIFDKVLIDKILVQGIIVSVTRLSLCPTAGENTGRF